MRIFIIAVVLTVSILIASISYIVSISKINDFYKRVSLNTAENFASFIEDTDYLAELRKVAESKEYQDMRDRAEINKDEKAVESYLKEKGLWDKFVPLREKMCKYLKNMDDVKYLYIIVLGDSEALRDMYLIDDKDNPLYQTGNYQSREPELLGVDTSQAIEPTISTGDWGWLCSSYAPVRDKDGKIICHVGCDVDMEGVMTERIYNVIFIAICSIAITLIVLLIAVIFNHTIFIKPLRRLTDESKKFKPQKDVSYDDAGVVNLYFKNDDEINEIYEVIRKMQMSMIDFLNDMAKLEKTNEDYLNSLRRAKSDIKVKKKQLGEKEKENELYLTSLKQAENDIKTKEEELGKMSKEVYHDALTHVGSKTAYVKRVGELNEMIENGMAEFAVAMVDMNDLKKINDTYGHKAGDSYIKGCCRIICDTFKYSQIFRIGGDEFVVVLIGQDYQNREMLVQKIAEKYNETFSDTTKPVFQRYSASVGLAALTEKDSTFEHVFKRADEEMYDAKMKFKEIHGSYR